MKLRQVLSVAVCGILSIGVASTAFAAPEAVATVSAENTGSVEYKEQDGAVVEQRITLDESFLKNAVQSEDNYVITIDNGTGGMNAPAATNSIKAGQKFEMPEEIVRKYLGVSESEYSNIMSQKTYAIPGLSEQQNAVAIAIWDEFRKNGFSEEMCAGILGNIQQECAFNISDLHQKSNGAYCGGMFQWEATPGYDTRLSRYMNGFCEANGFELWSVGSQVAYFIYESNTASGDNSWLGHYSNAGNIDKTKGYIALDFNSYEEMLNCRDIEQAVLNISANYCRAGIPRNDLRIQYALNAYEALKGRLIA